MNKQSALPEQCPSCGGMGCGKPCQYGDGDNYLLQLASNHYAEMAPHVKERRTAVIFKMMLDELSK